MIIKILALVLILAITWVWLNRGFFSSMVHMLCTVAAGAIAFAFWEPLAYLILDATPERGFLTFLGYIAWGAALLVPFALSLIVLRFITDAVLKTKVNPIGAVDYLGAGVCGAVSAMITVGVLFIGYGFMPGAGSVGAVSYAKEGGIGSLQRAGGLWIPAERFTAAFYGQLSETSLRTGEPLAEWYPDLDLTGYAINLSAGGGAARPSIPHDAVTITKTYTVGDEAGSARVSDLLVTGPGADAIKQGYSDIAGETVPTGTLFGVVARFGESAKEENGQVVLGNGQARLLMRSTTGETMVAHPVALISQARSSDAELYGRFPYDGEDLYIASVGGAAQATMGLEFVVPTGYTPESLMIKNTRYDLPAETAQSFADPGARFASLNSGQLAGGASVTDLDTSDAQRLRADEVRGSRNSAISVSDRVGYSFEVRQKGSLEIDGENAITRGTMKFRPEDLNARGVNRNVVIDKFASADDVEIVRVDVGPDSPASLLGRVAKTVGRVLPPQLVDTNGQAYQAVGYVYNDTEIVEISYDPSRSIRGLAELPTMSSSRSDQGLVLIFRVSKGVDLEHFAIGSKVVLTIDPPLAVE